MLLKLGEPGNGHGHTRLPGMACDLRPWALPCTHGQARRRPENVFLAHAAVCANAFQPEQRRAGLVGRTLPPKMRAKSISGQRQRRQPFRGHSNGRRNPADIRMLLLRPRCRHAHLERAAFCFSDMVFRQTISMSSALYSAPRLLRRHRIDPHDISDRASCSYAGASLELIYPAPVELHTSPKCISAIIDLCCAELLLPL